MAACMLRASHACMYKQPLRRPGSTSLHLQAVRSVRLPCRHGVVLRASYDPDGAYENLMRSKLFQSELVIKEFDSVMGEIRALSNMITKYPDMDLTGKRMYVDKLTDVTTRYGVFMKRLQLSEEPAAREFLRQLNAQMLEGGLSLPSMMDGLKYTLEGYRQELVAEEAVSADPVKHQEYLQGLRQRWRQSPFNLFTMDALLKTSKPEVVMAAQRDPQFIKAMKEISVNPSAMSQWLDHPTIGPLVADMWRAMQQQQQWRGSS